MNDEMAKLIVKLHNCEDCPIRCQAAKKPASVFHRIHRWHSAWWPGWQVYLAEQRERRTQSTAAAAD